MAKLSTALTWSQAQPLWAAQLNPVLASPTNDISILKNVNLIDGTNVLNHLLGKVQQGWFLTDIQGVATIYRPNTSPFNDLTLTLISSAAITCSIGVF